MQWMLNIITQRKQNAKIVKSSRHFVEPSFSKCTNIKFFKKTKIGVCDNFQDYEF